MALFFVQGSQFFHYIIFDILTSFDVNIGIYSAMVLEKSFKTYALLSIFRDYLSIRKGSTLFYKNLDLLPMRMLCTKMINVAQWK